MFKNLIFTFLVIGIAPLLCNPLIAMDQPESSRRINEIRSQIIQAAKTDDIALFKLLAGNYTGQLQDIRENGNNLLHIAAIHNASNIVRHLVEQRGFAIMQPTSSQEFAINLAKKKGNIAIVDYLAREQERQEKKAAQKAEEAEWNELTDAFINTWPKKQCSLCFDDKIESYLCTLSCDHTYCTACLNTMIDLAIKEKNTQSLCCPHQECKKKKRKLDETDIKKIIQDKDKLAAINEIQTQEWIAQQPNAEHCPTPDCGWAFINDAKQSSILCPKCSINYCWACPIKHDLKKKSCKDAQRDYQNAKQDRENEKWKQENTKPCPQCKSNIEKNKGCLHMTCLKCKHEFCWQCLHPYAQKGHGPFNCSLKPVDPSRNQAAQPLSTRGQLNFHEQMQEARRLHQQLNQEALIRGPLTIIPPPPLPEDQRFREEHLLSQIREQEALIRELELEEVRPEVLQPILARLAYLRQQLVEIRRNNEEQAALNPRGPLTIIPPPPLSAHSNAPARRANLTLAEVRLLEDLQQQEAMAIELQSVASESQEIRTQLARIRQQIEELTTVANLRQQAADLEVPPMISLEQLRQNQNVARADQRDSEQGIQRLENRAPNPHAGYSALNMRTEFRVFANHPHIWTGGALHKILQDTNFVERFISLSPEQQERWVNQIAIEMINHPHLNSLAQQAVVWLQELERIEQNSGAPSRSPYAFISDRPQQFTHLKLGEPAYVIEFTRIKSYDFKSQFEKFIRPLLPANTLYMQHYIGGVTTLEIHTITLTREQIQAILDQANAHFAQQNESPRRSEQP